MRENICRGKAIKTNEWVEGFYLEVRHPDDASLIHAFIIPKEKCIGTGVPEGKIDLLMVEVEASTVGQCINVKNIPSDRKLFEGDILQYYDNEIQVIAWDEEWNRLMLVSYAVRVKKAGGAFIAEVEKGWNELWEYELEQMQCLGNIHDQPEKINAQIESMKEKQLRIEKQLEEIYKSRKKQNRKSRPDNIL